jgi:peptide/nickel transport system substrate-binding protein
MRLIGTVAGVCVIATLLAACSGSKAQPTSTTGQSGGNSGGTSGGNSAPSSDSSSPTDVVNGGTFTMSMSADPGNLDPQGAATSNTFQMTQFAYDNLLSEGADGKIESGLATKWQVAGTKVTLTLHKAITCSDGAPFTAADAVANISYVADPKNKSPFLGVYLPGGAKASAGAAAGTVTITLAQPAPFVLDGLASLPMVCAKGMQDRKSLARKSDGTGPYQLTEAVSGDHYTYTKRSGYTWGPDGATTATAGLPSTIVVKIVQNETTAANLLLSGGLNAATILGSDVQRLESAHLFATDTASVAGQMWFNQDSGRPGADPAVRQALTSAVDLNQLAKVLTANNGQPATEFAALPPVACPGNSVTANLPTHDLDKAKQLLDSAGWKVGSGGVRSKGGKPLAVTFVYNSAQGAGGAAAAELASATWKQLGADVTVKPQDSTAISGTVFSTGNWDIVWLTLNVSSPDQIVPFMSGPAPAKGTNFAHINNAAYSSLVAKASAMDGSAGCSDWLKAEAELVKAVDVIPFANQIVKTFGYHARFAVVGALVPTSIRMLAS